MPVGVTGLFKHGKLQYTPLSKQTHTRSDIDRKMEGN